MALRPDLVWYPRAMVGRRRRTSIRRGRTAGLGPPGIVVDAKYKAEKPAGFPNADVYQLLGNCTALGLEEGHLNCAAGGEAGRTYRIPIGRRGSSVTVHAHVLDLDDSPARLIERVAELAAITADSTYTPTQRTE